MMGLAAALWGAQVPPADPTFSQVGAALAGAVSALLGLCLSAWAFLSFPTVSTGHYVLPEHRVVASGAYGFVRHPIYLGVFLIWAGIVLAFRSGWALALLALYVLPSYLVYTRAEERMLLASLGEEYKRYRETVGGLFPRVHPRGSP